MGKVKIKGTPFTTSSGKRLDTFEDVLEEQAKCHCGGVDCCLGYWTNIDILTGDVVAIFVEGGIVKSMPIEEAKTYLKAAKSVRG